MSQEEVAQIMWAVSMEHLEADLLHAQTLLGPRGQCAKAWPVDEDDVVPQTHWDWG